MDQNPHDDRRKQKRFRILQTVCCLTESGDCIEAQLQDFGARGVGLRSSSTLAGELNVELSFTQPIVRLSGKVVWTDGDQAGIQLDESTAHDVSVGLFRSFLLHAQPRDLRSWVDGLFADQTTGCSQTSVGQFKGELS